MNKVQKTTNEHKLTSFKLQVQGNQVENLPPPFSLVSIFEQHHHEARCWVCVTSKGERRGAQDILSPIFMGS
jgi:hypothetical protein